MKHFIHPLAGVAEQQVELIILDRERRIRTLRTLERLLDDAERVLNLLDATSDDLAGAAVRQ